MISEDVSSGIDLTMLEYVDSASEERDYAAIGGFNPASAGGICVCCNHCQLCLEGLNVGPINKYFDLALAGEELAKGRYDKLPLHASDRVKCGRRKSRCPFHVRQKSRTEEIANWFH